MMHLLVMDSVMPDDHSGSGVALIAITQNGVRLALQLQNKLPGSVCYAPMRHRFALAMGAVGFNRLGDLFPEIWSRHSALICIMATGIVVRQVAPLVRHKAIDPAVVVMDERGQFVISLLSGHIGGANRLAKMVAGLTGGQPVITTASDVQNKPALDVIAGEAGLEIENLPMLSRLSRAILEEEPVWIYDPGNYLAPHMSGLDYLFPASDADFLLMRMGSEATDSPLKINSNSPLEGGQGGVLGAGTAPYDPKHPPGPPLRGESYKLPSGVESRTTPSGIKGARVGIWISECYAPRGFECLELRPRNLVVGVGCNRGASQEEITALIRRVFHRERIALSSIRNLASIDLKADESGLLETGRVLDRPVVFYSRQDIEGVNAPNPSKIVEKHIGVQSVCEATALLSARNGVLIIPKQKTSNVTMAVAKVAFPS
jgi:cobalt-precorrin 5A hydrolase